MVFVDTKFRKRLGKRLREVRHAAKISQTRAALDAELAVSHVQKLERGVLDPKVSTIARLADTYNVTLSELFDGL